MKILYVTNMYPSHDHIYKGIHVKEQIDSLSSKYVIKPSIYYIQGNKSKLNYITSIFKINNIIRKENFDLIHIHFGLSGLFLLLNPFVKLPIIVTIHGSDANPLRWKGLFLFISKLVSFRATRVIILNDIMADRFNNFKKKLCKIPCGVDINKFNVGRNNSSTQFTIGFPGDQKRPEKNYQLFSSIINILREKNINIRVIEFHSMTRVEVVNALGRLDCIIMTSLSEGSPQIIKEGMIAGVPIISSNVGDVEVLLKNVKNCYVIRSFDSNDYVEKVMNIVNLPSENRTTNGRDKVLALGLDQDSVCNNIYKIYSELINNSDNEKD